MHSTLTETPNTVFGDKLREQVEERLKFYESGEVPRKNIDVMKEALDESLALNASLAEDSKKKKKKKKRKTQESESQEDQVEVPAKKIKKEKLAVEEEAPAEATGKKKKKIKN